MQPPENTLQLRILRLTRRARAHALDLSSPRVWWRIQREAARMHREHPGLSADLSSRARPDGRRYLIVSLNDRLRQVRLEAILAKSLQLRGARVDVLTFRSMRPAVHAFRALGVRSLIFWEDYVGVRSDWRLATAAALAECKTLQDFKVYEYRGARVGRQALSTVVRARHDP